MEDLKKQIVDFGGGNQERYGSEAYCGFFENLHNLTVDVGFDVMPYLDIKGILSQVKPDMSNRIETGQGIFRNYVREKK